jgi:hypothetical protein
MKSKTTYYTDDWKEKLVDDFYTEYYPNPRLEQSIFKYLDDLYYVSEDEVFATIYRKSDDYFMGKTQITDDLQNLFGLTLPKLLKIGPGEEDYIEPARNPIPRRVLNNWIESKGNTESLNEHEDRYGAAKSKVNPELEEGDKIIIISSKEVPAGYREPFPEHVPELYTPYMVIEKRFSGSRAKDPYHYFLIPEDMYDIFINDPYAKEIDDHTKSLFPWIYEWILDKEEETITEHLQMHNTQPGLNPELEEGDIIRVIEIKDDGMRKNKPETFGVYKVLSKGMPPILLANESVAPWYEIVPADVDCDNLYRCDYLSKIKRIYWEDTWIYANKPTPTDIDRKTISEHKELRISPELEVGDTIRVIDVDGEHDRKPEKFKLYRVAYKGNKPIGHVTSSQRMGIRIWYDIVPTDLDYDTVRTFDSRGTPMYHSKSLYPGDTWIKMDEVISEHKESKLNPDLMIGDEVTVLDVDSSFGTMNTAERFKDYEVIGIKQSNQTQEIYYELTPIGETEDQLLGRMLAGGGRIRREHLYPTDSWILKKGFLRGEHLTEHKESGLNPELEVGDEILVVDNSGTPRVNLPELYLPYVVEFLHKPNKYQPSDAQTYYSLDLLDPPDLETAVAEGIRIKDLKLYPQHRWIFRPGFRRGEHLSEQEDRNQSLIKKFLTDFWPKYRSQVYSELYNTYHPSTYSDSFKRPSNQFENALETIGEAVNEGRKLGLLDSSVDWSDIYHYETKDYIEDNVKRYEDDDGIETLNDQLEIMDNTNLDWIHGILLFDVLEDIVDEFKSYCGENSIDPEGIGNCMDDFPPQIEYGYPSQRTKGSGTLKQDYYTLYGFMRRLESQGINPTDYMKSPLYPSLIKLVDTGSTDYNEEGQLRRGTEPDQDDIDAEEILMDVPERMEEQVDPEDYGIIDGEKGKGGADYVHADEPDRTPFTSLETKILKQLHKNFTKDELLQLSTETPEDYRGGTGHKFWDTLKIFGIDGGNDVATQVRASKYAKWALDNWTEDGDYGSMESPIKEKLKWYDIRRQESGSQIEYKEGNTEVLGFGEEDAAERADYDFDSWGGEMETIDYGDYETYDTETPEVNFLRMDEAKRIVKVLKEQEGLDVALQHAEQESFGELMYDVLRRVRQIPLDKTVSPRRIQDILKVDDVNFQLNSGANLEAEIHDPYNRVRFYEYSQQLLKAAQSKGVRGHYFEGLLAGLFNGKVVSALPGEMIDPKEDVVINGIPYSAKLVRAQDKKWDSGSLFGGWKQAIIQLLIDKGIDPTDFKNTPFKVEDLTKKFYELIPEGDDDRDTYQFRHMELFLKDGKVDRKYREIILKHAFTTKSEEEIGEGLHWIFGLISGSYENFEGENLPKTNLTYYLIDTPSLINGILNLDIPFTKGRSTKMIRIDEGGMIEANGAAEHLIIFPEVSRQDLEKLLYDEEEKDMVYKVMGIFKQIAPNSGIEKEMHHKIADIIVDDLSSDDPKFIKKLQALFPKKKITTEQTIHSILEALDPELKYTIDHQYRTNPELKDEILKSLEDTEKSSDKKEEEFYYINADLSTFLDVPPKKIAQKFSDTNGYGKINYDMVGGNGIAFFTDKDLVIKLTSDKSEYHTANKLVGTDNEYIVKVLESAKIQTSHASEDFYIIVTEALNMTEEMEHIWEECCCGGDSPIEIDYMREPALILPPASNENKCIPIYDNLISIRENFAEYGIVWSDIGIDNLGIKNGHLAVLDLGDTKGGKEEGKEITLTLENIKVRPLTHKHIQKQLLLV